MGGPAAAGSRGDRPRPTMRDVAALAGVSLKTVSRVVNGEAGVSPGMLAQVERAIAQLDFRPNLSASALRRADGKTSAIAAILEDVANPFSASLHRAIEDAARNRGVHLFTGSVDEDPERERDLVRAFTMRRADALIVMPASDDHSYLSGELYSGTPIVFVDRPAQRLAADAVVVDNEGGAADAVRHLASAGHRKIAYLGDWLRIATAQERLQGYGKAMADAGLPVSDRMVVHDLRDVEAAARAVTGLLSAGDPPTALFTSQNLVTIGAVRALQQLGLQHEVAVVGFDDFPLADLLQPRITVVSQDPAEMGRCAADLVFRRLDGEDPAPQTYVLPTTLVPRGSGEIPAPSA